jgi:hypothetical protein
MTPRRSSGERLDAQGTIAEEHLFEAIRALIEQQRQPPTPAWRQIILGWIIAPALGIAAFVFTQQLAFRQVQDRIEEHERRISTMENHIKDSDVRSDKTRERIEDKLDNLTQIVVTKEHVR